MVANLFNAHIGFSCFLCHNYCMINPGDYDTIWPYYKQWSWLQTWNPNLLTSTFQINSWKRYATYLWLYKDWSNQRTISLYSSKSAKATRWKGHIHGPFQGCLNEHFKVHLCQIQTTLSRQVQYYMYSSQSMTGMYQQVLILYTLPSCRPLYMHLVTMQHA